MPAASAGNSGSVWIDGTIKGDEAIRETLEQIDIVSRLIRAYPRDLEQAYTADDIVRIHKDGRVASLIGIEGGRQIGGSLPALRQFYRLGARYMTLTHNQTTEWADSGTDDPKYDGISPFGLLVVKEMNRLGMLIDISHVAPADDEGRHRRQPRACHLLALRRRRLEPASAQRARRRAGLLPANGGVIMVTFVPPFLSAEVALGREQSAEAARLKSLYSFDKARQEAELKKWEAAHPAPEVTIATVADHIEHAVKIAGHDHVGIGGDLDGIPTAVTGLDGVEDYPALFAELIRRGWSDADLAKLAGGNILRVLRQAEAVAASMKDEPPVMATSSRPMSEPPLRLGIIR
jgi:membrane dipeptidase